MMTMANVDVDGVGKSAGGFGVGSSASALIALLNEDDVTLKVRSTAVCRITPREIVVLFPAPLQRSRNATVSKLTIRGRAGGLARREDCICV